MSNMSIRLHPTHGLNPTLTVCWWCGKETGEIALLGAAYKGEAPHHMVVNHNPCHECEALQSRGVVMIEGNESSPNGWTGRWCVVKTAAAEKMLSADMFQQIMRKGPPYRCVIAPDAWDELGLPR